MSETSDRREVTQRTHRAETIPSCRGVSVAELDQRLEQAVEQNERSEKLICFYLLEMRNRRGHESFGFSNIYDYAAERFGFSERKTRYLLHLGLRLEQLPQITAALAEGRIGWTKASKIASVAHTDDEAMWLESALSLSVRELDRRLRDGEDVPRARLHLSLSEDQAAVWQSALEVCRRLAGEELDPGRCLELIAGEFLATYAYLAHQKEDESSEETRPAPSPRSEEAAEPESASRETVPSLDEELAEVSSPENLACPENDDLPSPVAVPYSQTWRKVLERDGYSCRYPGCSARATLQVHHITHRSLSGSKGRGASNASSNLLTTCAFHHRMLHGGVIGVKGEAPSELEWRRPKLMDMAMRRPAMPTPDFDVQLGAAFEPAETLPGLDFQPAALA